ncbi:MAG: hypothetical protein QM710_01080 [Flavobacterium sp.]
MKNILLILFMVFNIHVFSQNGEITLVLKDAETNQPIEDATVFVAKTKQTLLSNSEGMVSFVLNGVSNVQVTHSSYVTVKLRSSTLKDKVNEVLLKSSITGLEEIVVTKQHPQRILKNLVENSIKKLTVPACLKVYSREFFKLNGANSYYNDGLMNFQLFGNSKNFKTDILIEQNRSYGLVNEEISDDVLGYNLNDIMQNYYNFEYLDPILEPKAKKDYEFLIKSYSKNEDYYQMIVTPVDDDTKILRDDFTIVYDRKRKVIVEVSSYISPTTLANAKDKTSVGSKNIYKSLFKTIYRLDNSNYYLISSREEIGFEKIEKNKKIDIEVKNYFVTTNFSNHNFTYKDNEVFKDKTLYNKKNSILTNYWDVSGLIATEEEQAIIASLEFRP